MTLKQAYQLLEDCATIVLVNEESAVIYPEVRDLNGEKDNIFLILNWTGSDGWTFSHEFTEGMNQEVENGNTIMVLRDVHGSKFDIQILNVTPLNV